MKQWHWILLCVVVVLSVIAEFIVPHDPGHAEHWWSVIPAFYAFFGFVGCVVIILFSKALGKWFLQKREDYYDGR
jgi:threonine/homoserine/homoserine lactone efflux protein